MFISNWIRLSAFDWHTIEGVGKIIISSEFRDLSDYSTTIAIFPSFSFHIIWLEVGNWPTWSSRTIFFFSALESCFFFFFVACWLYISLDQSNLCSKNSTFLFMVIHMMLNGWWLGEKSEWDSKINIKGDFQMTTCSTRMLFIQRTSILKEEIKIIQRSNKNHMMQVCKRREN